MKAITNKMGKLAKYSAKINIVAVCFFLSAAMLAAKPAIEVECGDAYDWGTVKYTAKSLEAKVKLYNRGTETLHIQHIRPGCGCTIPKLDKDKIEPNEFGTLEIELDISNYEGDVYKAMTINTNDPDRPSINLGLKVSVFKPLSMMPKFLNFNQLFLNEEGVARMTIKNNSDKPIKFTEIETTPFTIKHNLKEGLTIKPKSEFVLEAKFTPKTLEPVNGKIRMTTTDPDQLRLEISVWAIVAEKK